MGGVASAASFLMADDDDALSSEMPEMSRVKSSLSIFNRKAILYCQLRSSFCPAEIGDLLHTRFFLAACSWPRRLRLLFSQKRRRQPALPGATSISWLHSKHVRP